MAPRRFESKTGKRTWRIEHMGPAKRREGHPRLTFTFLRARTVDEALRKFRKMTGAHTVRSILDFTETKV